MRPPPTRCTMRSWCSASRPPPRRLRVEGRIRRCGAQARERRAFGLERPPRRPRRERTRHALPHPGRRSGAVVRGGAPGRNRSGARRRARRPAARAARGASHRVRSRRGPGRAAARAARMPRTGDRGAPCLRSRAHGDRRRRRARRSGGRGLRAPRAVHVRCRFHGMVRAASARPHPPLHARPSPARDRARVAGGVRPLPVRVAAGQARRPARGRRGARRRGGRAGRVAAPAAAWEAEILPAGSWGLRPTCSTGCASQAGHRGRGRRLRCGIRRGVRSGRFGRLRLRCFRGRGGGRLRCGWRRAGRSRRAGWWRRPGRWPRAGRMAKYRRSLVLFPIRRRGEALGSRIQRRRDGGFGNTLFGHEQGAEQGPSFPRVEMSRPRRSPPGPGASSRSSKPAERRSSTTFSRRPAPATGCGRRPGELIAQGRVSADGFAGLRAFTGASARRLRAIAEAGRWSCVARRAADAGNVGEDGVEAVARTLLRRYGVVFKPLLARESITVPWRDLLREFRRFEARGEIRGGRFVAGFTGEQYALPEAVETLRRVRRAPADGAIVTLSAADPLNLTGVVCLGERVSATASTRIAFGTGCLLPP